MAQLIGTDEIEAVRIELAEIGRSLRSSFRQSASFFRSSSGLGSSARTNDLDDEVVSRWAAVERLPTYDRLRSSLFEENGGNEGKKVVDVTKLGGPEKHMFIERLIRHIEHDNLKLLHKMRRRIDKVGVKLPTIEVRYANLRVEAECQTVNRLPGLPSQDAHVHIIKDVSGVIRPGRITLLLGPPGCGKTTLLKALSGNLDKSLKAISVEGQKTTLQTDYILKVISRKDQEQYWHDTQQSYRYVSVDTFARKFMESPQGKKLSEDLSSPFDKSKSHKSAICFSKYSLPKWTLFKACMSRENLLMKRNSFIYVFKAFQMHVDLIHANNYMGALFYTLIILLIDGIPELSMTVARLEVFYKQRDLFFYPAWAFAIPNAIVRIPLSMFVAVVWTSVTYYTIGYSPEAGRFFRQMLLVFFVHLASISVFRFLASVFRGLVASATAGSMTLLFALLFSGFMIPRPPGSRVIISSEKLSQLQGSKEPDNEAQKRQEQASMVSPPSTTSKSNTDRMVLPFEPLSIVFQDVQYYVETPALVLLKAGGRVIYCGQLGRYSSKVIEYFESISGVPRIKDNYNPATWMLEVSSTSSEAELGIDFADIYKNSALHESNKELVRKLSKPAPGSKDLHFPTRYSQNGWVQFKTCLWKQHWSYWRSPSYNLMRTLHMLFASLLYGLLFWGQAKKIDDQQSLFTLLGSMYSSTLFCGINNASSILAYVNVERTVFYREKFSGMYAPWAYSTAQVIVEIPYLLAQTLIFIVITYPMIGYEWSAPKVFWYFYTMLCSLLYFTYLGMMLIAITPSFMIAAISQSGVYTMLNLFSGFLIPRRQIPKWWVWCYYMMPTSWSLNAMLTSQFGDVGKQIVVFGQLKTVSAFLNDYFGYRHDRLPLVAVMLIMYPILFASIFTLCISKLNFQKR
ncbi:UNVERIFIED_CONTAM: Pleiotropic drug resistance protein 3 [Sesamum latifolium]|uniref:Pleiotropic drug resistance protein 3 n=1 Tax=Sesamum latifolium TaxID=2727402 RepID=A0AAW2XN40_9LAMI